MKTTRPIALRVLEGHIDEFTRDIDDFKYPEHLNGPGKVEHAVRASARRAIYVHVRNCIREGDSIVSVRDRAILNCRYAAEYGTGGLIDAIARVIRESENVAWAEIANILENGER